MKLVVRQYVQGLKERDELDVLLPQILSEIGYEIIHHPGRGTRQAGVDVAAVGPDPDANGEKTLHLFVIKSGNLGRGDWDGTPQAVRPSLNEVREDYIPHRIPDQFSDLPISICVCMGGEMTEAIRTQWRGFVERNKSEKIHYREWNGDRLANLFLSVGHKLVVEKIGPHADKKFALSNAVRSGSELDVNLALFEVMGRAALLGIWSHFIGVKSEGTQRETHLKQRDEFQNIAVSLINENPTLTSPMRDDHHIEIGLLMLLAQAGGGTQNVQGYIQEIAVRLTYRYRRRMSWPTHFQDYRELARHPVDQSEEYFRSSTKGSVLVPFISTALERIGAVDELTTLRATIDSELKDMTQQVWVPREGTNDFMWRQGTSQGIAIPVPMMELDENPDEFSLSSQIDDIVESFKAIHDITAIQQGLMPLFLTACRHHRLPLPPHFWLTTENEAEQND